MLAGAIVLLIRPCESSGVDAISAASIAIANGAINGTTAVVNYSEDRFSSGTRTLCYAVAPAAPGTQNCKSQPAYGREGSFTISNLKLSTQYNYTITASDGRHIDYSASGTFKTLARTGIAIPTLNPRPAIPGLGPIYDLSGRYLPGPSAAGLKVSRSLPGSR